MKRLLLFAGFTCLCFAANAQSFRFGLKAGVNYSDVRGKDLDKNSHKFRADLHAGIMVNILPTGDRHFSIQPELIYSRKGYENHSSSFEVRNAANTLLYTAQESGVVRLNYLELPVMLNYKTGIVIFEAGPQVSFLVGVHDGSYLKQTLPDGTAISTNSQHQLFNESDVKKIDFGFAAGLRLESSNGVALGFRFNQGFIKIQPSGNAANKPPNGVNQCYQLFASYLIPE